MNELFQKYKEKFILYWQQLEKGQKVKLVIIAIFLLASLSIFAALATQTKYEVIYTSLDQKTAGTVVNSLDEMGVSYKLSAGGSTIAVPESQADKIFVSLASELDLSSGNVYTKFWDSAKMGMTDDQFQILERGAIEERLRGLIKGIEGISDAYVMVTMADEKVFYSEEEDKATASVVVKVEPGVQLTANQIKTIYNLIAMSVPNLPIENITLTDQYGETLEFTQYNNATTDLSTYNQQIQIQQDFQKDLKTEIDTMLKRIMGPENVSVSVFAKMNFDQKTTIENLTQPVVDGKGIARSVQTIQESFSGDGSNGGVTGTGSSQIPGYPSSDSSDGNYEYIEETINYDVNQITREIISSPYSLEDLSVIVAVNMPQDDANTEETIEAIKSLIRPIISAALDEQEVDIDSRIEVVAHEFDTSTIVFEEDNTIDPLLLYGAIGLSVLAIGGLGFSIIRRNRKKKGIVGEEIMIQKQPAFDFTPEITEEALLQKEIQKLSNNKPDEFVKLLRTWLYDD